MINQNVLVEKFKYLILMNAKSTQFDIKNLYVELDYINQDRTSIDSYDIGVTFDYEGALEPNMYSFAHDIQRMSEKMGDLLSEYVITKGGKIVTNKEGNVSVNEGSVWNIEYKVDEKHIFDISYRFVYQD